MGRSQGFASTPSDYPPFSDSLSLRIRVLNTSPSQGRVTRRLIMQQARRHPDKSGLRPLVSTRFQVLFTPLFGVLFTFPSRYWFTIGLSGVFSLTGWCRQIPTRRLRPRGTQDTTILLSISRTQLSCSMAGFPTPFRFSLIFMLWSYYPGYAVT